MIPYFVPVDRESFSEFITRILSKYPFIEYLFYVALVVSIISVYSCLLGLLKMSDSITDYLVGISLLILWTILVFFFVCVLYESSLFRLFLS